MIGNIVSFQLAYVFANECSLAVLSWIFWLRWTFFVKFYFRIMHWNSQCLNEWMAKKQTHSSGPRIRDTPLEGHPLKVGPLPVSERPVEDGEDVGHVVDTHRWAFKHGAEEMRCILVWNTTTATYYTHNLETHPARIFCSRLLRCQFLRMSCSLGGTAATPPVGKLTSFPLIDLMWFGSVI